MLYVDNTRRWKKKTVKTPLALYKRITIPVFKVRFKTETFILIFVIFVTADLHLNLI